jgi:hypothetical protein
VSEPIFRRALGPAFERLHPRLREQYGITSGSRCAFVGRGVMEEVWHGRWYTLPFLHIAAKRSGMFPETGSAIPFTIANYAYVDGLGRETITWSRTFDFPSGASRRFDETIVYSERRRCPVVYMGTHQHLAVELRTSVDHVGGLVITTGAQRMYEWRLGFWFPLMFSGVAVAEGMVVGGGGPVPRRCLDRQPDLGTHLWIPRMVHRRGGSLQ